MRIDVVEMFTPEIECVELNTLRDEITFVIPPEFEVELRPTDVGTSVLVTRKED